MELDTDGLLPCKRPRIITNYNNQKPIFILANKQNELYKKEIAQKNIIIEQQQHELSVLKNTIQRLKYQNNIIQQKNSVLKDESKNQKERAEGFEEMNRQLFSEIVDMHRNYFVEHTPINRDYCDYLS